MERRDPVATGVLIALSTIGMILALWLLAAAIDVVIIILVTIVFATGVQPMVAWLEHGRLWRWRSRVPRSLSIILVYLLLIVVAGAAVWIIGSALVQEIMLLIENLPHYYRTAVDGLANFHARHPRFPDVAVTIEHWISRSGSYLGYATTVVRGAFSVATFLGGVVVILFLSFYGLMAQERIHEGIVRLVPPRHRQRYSHVLSDMGNAVGGWLRGQVTLAIIVGVAIGVAMWILGVPFPLTIAAVGAVGELAPLVGPIIAAVPAVLLALVMPLWKIIVVIVFFIVLEEIDAHYLTPMIMKGRVGLHPIMTILVLLTGALLLGAAGALLAVPIAAGIRVFLAEIVFPAIEKSETEAEQPAEPEQ